MFLNISFYNIYKHLIIKPNFSLLGMKPNLKYTKISSRDVNSPSPHIPTNFWYSFVKNATLSLIVFPISALTYTFYAKTKKIKRKTKENDKNAVNKKIDRIYENTINMKNKT